MYCNVLYRAKDGHFERLLICFAVSLLVYSLYYGLDPYDVSLEMFDAVNDRDDVKKWRDVGNVQVYMFTYAAFHKEF